MAGQFMEDLSQHTPEIGSRLFTHFIYKSDECCDGITSENK
jgi:hypothetical protein